MRRHHWFLGVSAVALTLAMGGTVHAQSAATPAATPFDWSRSYVAGSLGRIHAGDMAATEVYDKFGTLGTKSQSGLMTSAEYGRLIDAHHDVRIALRSAYVPEHIVDAVDTFGLSYGKSSLAFETLDVEAGHRLRLSDPTSLRLFAGVRGIHARDTLEEVVRGTRNLGQKVSADTWGIGPRAGLEFAHQLGANPVFVTGGVDGSVLFGHTDQNLLIDSFGGSPPFFSLNATSTPTIYTLGARLGLTWLASPTTAFTLGYQVEQLWNLRQAYSDLSAGDLGTIDNRGHTLVHGAFAKVAMALEPGAASGAARAAAPMTWTGFHVGGHAGWGFTVANAGNATLTDGITTYVFSGAGNLEGLMAGFHGGYDHQFGALLVGLEGDVSWTDLSGIGQIVPGLSVTFDAHWLASARARIGWAQSNALFYLTGGAAWASVSGQLLATTGPSAAQTNGYQGYVLGGGLEYQFAPLWSVRAEYLRYALGTQHYALSTATGSYSADMTFNTDVIRIGLTRILPVGR